MRVKCPDCSKRYQIKDSLVTPQGIRVRCPNCNFIIPIASSMPGAKPTASGSPNETSSANAEDTTPYSTTLSEAEAAAVKDEQLPELTEDSIHTEARNKPGDTSVAPKLPSDRDHEEMEELSLPGEISQISYESDPSYHERSLRDRAKNIENTETAKPVARSRTAGRTLTPRPVQRFNLQSKRFKVAAMILFVLAIVFVAWSVKRRPEKPSPKNTPVLARPPIETTSPPSIPVIVDNIAPAELKIIQAAISFMSRASLEYAVHLLSTHSEERGANAWEAYTYGLLYYFYRDSAAQEKGLLALSQALLEGGDHPQALLASALLYGKSSAFMSSQKIVRKLEKVLSTSTPEALTISKAEVSFVEALADIAQGRTDAATITVERLIRGATPSGPALLLAEQLKIERNDLNPKQQLARHRQGILAQFVEFKVFDDPKSKPPEKVDEKAPTKTSNLPKVQSSQLKAALGRGDDFYKKEQYNDALRQYLTAQKLTNDKDASVVTRLGFTWLKLYRLDEAYSSFNRALALDISHADAHKGLGAVYDQLGDVDKAVREYTLYLQLKPNASDAAVIRDNIKKLKPS